MKVFSGENVARKAGMIFLMTMIGWGSAMAGPYRSFGVSGFVDAWLRPVSAAEPNALLHPVFSGRWVSGVDYRPANLSHITADFRNPAKATGPVTGSVVDIVSLGELQAEDLSQGAIPGSITLTFAECDDPNVCDPNGIIPNVDGYDFAVFENGFIVESTDRLLGYSAGQVFAELAYVEVSSNGIDFARFPSVSLTVEMPGAFGSLEGSDVHGLAGAHPNFFSLSQGTPFDLADLADHPAVVGDAVDLEAIRYLRLVDIPGDGSFSDGATGLPDPNTLPSYQPFTGNHPVYDPWPTLGSGGFDLEAVGLLQGQAYAADINLDGRVNLIDFYIFESTWMTRLGQAAYLARCDLHDDGQYIIDVADLVVFGQQWLGVEAWLP